MRIRRVDKWKWAEVVLTVCVAAPETPGRHPRCPGTTGSPPQTARYTYAHSKVKKHTAPQYDKKFADFTRGLDVS